MKTKYDALDAKAKKAGEISTDLMGDRYFAGDYSQAMLSKEQDDYLVAFQPAIAIDLIADVKALAEALERVTKVLDYFGGMPDSMIDPGIWQGQRAEEKIVAARAALARIQGEAG